MPNLELVVAALQERIGQLVANYETQVALLRAELTELSQKEKAKEEVFRAKLQVTLDEIKRLKIKERRTNNQAAQL